MIMTERLAQAASFKVRQSHSRLAVHKLIKIYQRLFIIKRKLLQPPVENGVPLHQARTTTIIAKSLFAMVNIFQWNDYVY